MKQKKRKGYKWTTHTAITENLPIHKQCRTPISSKWVVLKILGQPTFSCSERSVLFLKSFNNKHRFKSHEKLVTTITTMSQLVPWLQFKLSLNFMAHWIEGGQRSYGVTLTRFSYHRQFIHRNLHPGQMGERTIYPYGYG